MEITYKADITPTPNQIVELYENAGLPRPTNDKDRIKKMFENSDLIVTAWQNELLIGVCYFPGEILNSPRECGLLIK
jgi:hypothetical protein